MFWLILSRVLQITGAIVWGLLLLGLMVRRWEVIKQRKGDWFDEREDPL